MSVALMNEMTNRGHEIALLTWDRSDAQPHYEMAPSIVWSKLDQGNSDYRAGWKLRLQRQVSIRRIVRNFAPDVIIGFQSGTFLAVRTAVLGMGIPAIAAERNSPQRFDFVSEGKIRQRVYLSFLLARYVTVQFASYIKIYPRYLRSRIVSIPNPVWPSKVRTRNAQRERDACSDTLLTVGRLSYQKNQAFLIHAFSLVAAEFPNWKLVFVGDGESEDELKALARGTGLGDRIVFAGAVKDVSSWYAKADIFALPSHFEGFPNALAEALAHGVPAIGLRETAGVNELIKHGENGLLTDKTARAFADGLRTMMADAEGRTAMSQRAISSIAQYAPEKVFDQWEALFLGLGK